MNLMFGVHAAMVFATKRPKKPIDVAAVLRLNHAKNVWKERVRKDMTKEMPKYLLEIRKIKDNSLKRTRDMKAKNFSEALDEQAKIDAKLSDKVYSHVREI